MDRFGDPFAGTSGPAFPHFIYVLCYLPLTHQLITESSIASFPDHAYIPNIHVESQLNRVTRPRAILILFEIRTLTISHEEKERKKFEEDGEKEDTKMLRSVKRGVCKAMGAS